MNISSNDEGGLRLQNEYFNLSDLPWPLLSLLACREAVPAAQGINLLHPDCMATGKASFHKSRYVCSSTRSQTRPTLPIGVAQGIYLF